MGFMSENEKNEKKIKIFDVDQSGRNRSEPVEFHKKKSEFFDEENNSKCIKMTQSCLKITQNTSKWMKMAQKLIEIAKKKIAQKSFKIA